MKEHNGRFKRLLKRVWTSLVTYGLWLLSRIVIPRMKEFEKAPPKFKIGDLVIINNLGLVFVQKEASVEYGLIQTEAYHHHHVSSKDLILFGWWTYDVLVDGELIKMMPETFLKEVNIDESSNNQETVD